MVDGLSIYTTISPAAAVVVEKKCIGMVRYVAAVLPPMLCSDGNLEIHFLRCILLKLGQSEGSDLHALEFEISLRCVLPQITYIVPFKIFQSFENKYPS